MGRHKKQQIALARWFGGCWAPEVGNVAGRDCTRQRKILFFSQLLTQRDTWRIPNYIPFGDGNKWHIQEICLKESAQSTIAITNNENVKSGGDSMNTPKNENWIFQQVLIIPLLIKL